MFGISIRLLELRSYGLVRLESKGIIDRYKLNSFIHLLPIIQWNTPSIDFYEKGLGASPMSEWVGMRLEEDGIEGLKKFSL